ncbi:MAG: hypothetical protein COA54_01270 [Thiotrichaceae bacterium]|nr:MAG: hypothetical protein COA54_01270 [Thiotrichaceae bacterium]
MIEAMPLPEINTLQLGSETWSTPAIKTKYATFDSVIVACDRKGNVVAFDGSSGEKVWSFNALATITASPVLIDLSEDLTVVIIGDEKGLLRALTLDNGEVLWQTRCGKAIRSTVAADNKTKTLYVGGYGAWFFCINAITGSIYWNKYLPKHEFFRGTKQGVVSSPLLADVDLDGELEVVTGMRSRRVFCMSAKTGTFKWFREFKYDPDSSPSFAVVDGKPLVFIGGGEHTSGAGDNSVFALHGNDGSVCWKTKVGGGLDSSPVIADINGDGRLEVVITSLADASCYALDAASGKIIWRYKFGPTKYCRHDEKNICKLNGTDVYFTGDAICRSYTTPLIADLDNDGKFEVVVGSNNGQLVILSGETGSILWTVDTEGMIRGSPVLADISNDGINELLVCSNDKILIYQTSSKGPAWPMFKGNAQHTGWLNPDLSLPSGLNLPKQRYLWVKLIWYWLIKDLFRYFIFQFDRRVLKPFGLHILDYYY